MKILEGIYLVGSGNTGFKISNDFDCHVYLIDGGKEKALIDAGGGRETEKILKNIESHGIDTGEIDRVFLTHSHSDHAAGAYRLKELLDPEILAPEKEIKFIETGDEESLCLDKARGRGRFYPPDYEFTPCEINVPLRDKDIFDIGDFKLKALNVPGHSLDTICFYTEVDDNDFGKKKVLFSSDVVFCKGLISLLNCEGSSLSAYRNNITKLQGIEVDTLLPGHFTFCMNKGQEEIDKALEAFKEMSVPESAF